MEISSMFNRLKTEVIPVKEAAFMGAMQDIVNGSIDQETVLKLLETCYKDEQNEIRTFMAEDRSCDWKEKASILYKNLVKGRQEKFAKSLEKKFDLIGPEEKEKRIKEKAEKSKNRYEDHAVETIKLPDIKIRRLNKGTVSNVGKLVKALNYYKNYHEFNNVIMLDRNNFLVTGYTNYLLCKMFDVTDVLIHRTKNVLNEEN